MLMFAKKMKESVKKNRKGYTLTELIVVVAILGILAAVGAPMILNQIDKARTSADDANAKAISNAYKVAVANDSNNAKATSALDLSNKIKAYLNPIPTPKQSGVFNVNVDTGETTLTSAAINVSPNFTPVP